MLAQDSARVLAGGTDLVPQLKEGRRSVSDVVDLKKIPDLTEIKRSSDGGWILGAAATIGALGRHVSFASEHAALLSAARLIGSLQIQNRASLGGNLCNAAPSADAVPLLICLAAECDIAGPDGIRCIPVAELGIAPGRTSLRPNEVLVAIRLPPRTPRHSAHYLRFTPRREMDIAIAGAAASLLVDDQGNILDARIALASVAPTALIASGAQAALIGKPISLQAFASAAALAAQEARPISDSRGSADYRRTLVDVLTRRALEACAQALGHPAA